MRKLVIIFISLMLLVGCSGSNRKYMDENRSAGVMDEAGCKAVVELFYDVDRMYHIGSGVYLNEIEGNDLVESADIIYTFYTDYQVTTLIMLHDGEYSVVNTDPEAMKALDKNLLTDFMIIRVHDSIYLVSSSEVLKLTSDDDELEKKDSDVMKKIQNMTMKPSKLGSWVNSLTGKGMNTDGKGNNYSNRRIVVRFTEGDVERKIADFESFCNGKLKSTVKGSGLYVFLIDQRNYLEMKELVEDAKKLDYVDDAFMDEAKRLNS